MADDKTIELLEAVVNKGGFPTFELSQIRLLAPIPYPKRNVFCIGKNYEEHGNQNN